MHYFPFFYFSLSDSELISRCREGNVDAVRRLIADKADINAWVKGKFPLLLAVEQTDVRLLETLLQAGADIAHVPILMRTVLMVVSMDGHLEGVRFLLKHQPASLLDARDELGHTALLYALKMHHVDVASALLDAGADATIANNRGTTTLMECTDVGLARRLLELGVDVHARDADGMDALLFACKRGNVELASLLLTSGASVYSVNGTGMSALALACEGGHAEVVELLLYTEPELGDEDARAQWVAWLFAEDGSGWNAMHWAAAGSHRGCVQALLDIGFDANLPDTEGVTPLHLVDDVEVARILLDEGAEDLSDDYGHTAASRACESSSRVEVLRLLLQRFPDSDHPDRPLLFDAAQAGNLEAVRLLLAARPPGYINKRGFSGGSALHFTKDPEAVRLLLELGIDPRIVDNEGKTSIMSSFEAACVRLLLDAAPDLVGARDLEGRTAVMHLSCSGMHYKALEELFRYCEERGVDAGVNIKDLNGDTALHIAMIGGCLPAVELLLEKGAEVLNSGCGGTTALMKPLLDEAAIQSTYNELYFHWMTDTRDTNAAACVRALLDAVLRGGEVDGGASCEAQEDAVNDEE